MASQSALINIMQKASIAASRGLLRDFGEVENLQVSRKGPADFVSRADINAERTIRRELEKARPDWGFQMEEGGAIEGANASAPVWVIDPLDGTTNFLHGIPHFAISIAVMETDSQGRLSITAGTVFDPVKNEFFFAERGQGAFLNGRRLRVSGRQNMLCTILSRRRNAWFSGTMALFSFVFRSNTHTGPNFRVPLTAKTHECPMNCLSSTGTFAFLRAWPSAQPNR